MIKSFDQSIHLIARWPCQRTSCRPLLTQMNYEMTTTFNCEVQRELYHGSFPRDHSHAPHQGPRGWIPEVDGRVGFKVMQGAQVELSKARKEYSSRTSSWLQQVSMNTNQFNSSSYRVEPAGSCPSWNPASLERENTGSMKIRTCIMFS